MLQLAVNNPRARSPEPGFGHHFPLLICLRRKTDLSTSFPARNLAGRKYSRDKRGRFLAPRKGLCSSCSNGANPRRGRRCGTAGRLLCGVGGGAVCFVISDEWEGPSSEGASDGLMATLGVGMWSLRLCHCCDGSACLCQSSIIIIKAETFRAAFRSIFLLRAVFPTAPFEITVFGDHLPQLSRSRFRYYY